MEKQIIDILNKWAEFSKFDENRRSFNLGNIEYPLHKVGETVSSILKNEFDSSGVTSVLYIRKSFDEITKDTKVSLYNAITHKYDDAIEMYNILHQVEVEKYENTLVDKVSEIITQITGLQIGERDTEKEKEIVVNCLADVVENLKKLNVNCFKKSNESIGIISKFSTRCEISSTLAGCVLEVEATHPDGIFLYYIEDDKQLGGYFTFIIKSNGNILSINDKVNEMYAGQHNYSRNGRWTENKQYDIFPYTMVQWEGEDYKGYPLKQIIDEDKLQLKSIGPNNYISIILAMMFLCNKYQDKVLDMDLTYSSMMLKCNVSETSKISENTKNEIVVYKDSQIAEYHNNYEISFNTEDVIKGTGCILRGKLDNLNRNNQELIDIWGKGFTLDTSTLNKHYVYPRMNSLEPCEFESEVIGDYETIQIQSYMDGCTQLADYMRKNIYDAYEKFIEENESIKNWYQSKILNSIETIYKLCVERFFYNKHENFIKVENDEYHKYLYGSVILNENYESHWNEEYHCPVTNNFMNIAFKFTPLNDKDIQTILGDEDLPDIIKGYRRNGHDTNVNNLLNRYDPTDLVGTIFERNEANRYLITVKNVESDSWGYIKDRSESPEFDFSIGIGFSKRGLNKLRKLYDAKLPLCNK